MSTNNNRSVSNEDPSNPLEIRTATSIDTDAILDVCSTALGWTDPPFDRELFRWKHLANAFGPSLMLVAADENTIAAVRPLMRWRFANTSGTMRAARAVDTATHPSYQGQGLFRRLTEAGLEQLQADGTDFVFNTPNEKSLPGYLKMGWVDTGQVTIGFQIRSPGVLPRLFRSRVAADKRSIKTPHLGQSAEDGLGNVEAIDHPPDPLLTTDHNIDTLRWRYAGGPISYRFIPLTAPNTGIVLRLRNRGRSRELVVAETVGPCPPDDVRDAISSAMKQTRADYCLTAIHVPRTFAVSRFGPTLALRSVKSAVDGDMFRWNPGDLELF